MFFKYKCIILYQPSTLFLRNPILTIPVKIFSMSKIILKGPIANSMHLDDYFYV